MIGRLEGMTAAITGGASGIGEATARRFLEEGANVVIGDIQTMAGETLEAELGPRAISVACDVTREDDVAALVDGAVERFELRLELGNPLLVGFGLLFIAVRFAVERRDGRFVFVAVGPDSQLANFFLDAASLGVGSAELGLDRLVLLKQFTVFAGVAEFLAGSIGAFTDLADFESPCVQR